jgi:hypothetical protein
VSVTVNVDSIIRLSSAKKSGRNGFRFFLFAASLRRRRICHPWFGR